MRTGFDIRIDVVLEHCCHCYDNLGLRMCFWTKDTRSCSSHGQSDYLRSSFSTKKEYSNLSSKIRKVDCNTNSTMVFNLGALRSATRSFLFPAPLQVWENEWVKWWKIYSHMCFFVKSMTCEIHDLWNKWPPRRYDGYFASTNTFLR